MLNKLKMIVALSGVLVGGVALADPAGGGGGRGAAIQKYDADKDGTLDDAQWALLKVKGGRWHKFFVDTGILFWEEQESVDDGDRDTTARLRAELEACDSAAVIKVGRHFGKDHAIISRMFEADYWRLYGRYIQTNEAA